MNLNTMLISLNIMVVPLAMWGYLFVIHYLKSSLLLIALNLMISDVEEFYSCNYFVYHLFNMFQSVMDSVNDLNRLDYKEVAYELKS